MAIPDSLVHNPSIPAETKPACTNARLIHSGKEYFTVLEALIASAKEEIHLQTYIFHDDHTGQQVASQLINAADRGVRVHLLADGYASQGLPDSFISNLKKAGINFRFFDPLLKSKYFYFGRRLHHKVVTIDNTQALVGGINISDHYNDTGSTRAWMDFALLVEGDVVSQLQAICRARMQKQKLRLLERKVHKATDDICDIQVRINDWVRGRNEITRSYLTMLAQAKSHVIIMSSYFIPGKLLRRYLRKASRRGVQVQVIAAGRSDVGIAKYAERYLYRWLLRNNIAVYEYQPVVLHAKLATVDGHRMTVGSYNVNDISAYASIELNLELESDGFVKQVEAYLHDVATHHCKRITPDDVRHASLLEKFLQYGAYIVYRTLFLLTTFYFRKHTHG